MLQYSCKDFLDLFQNKDLGISEPNWSQKDVFLITYADSIYEEKNNKLKTLSKFLDKYCKKQFNNLHILPFFPYSSDDGFSITDSCREYLLPLIEGENYPPYNNGLPEYVVMKKTKVSKKLPPFEV